MKKYIILLFILILALGLRVYKITENPPGLYSDEVAIGYNAYSILQTGKDEWGISWPILFRSYDDYKPPAYIYTVAFFEKFLGPTELAVRLPSVICGVVTVMGIFFLTRKLFKNDKAGLIAALLLATSMWHIQFSRAGFEASEALMFVVLGIWLFLESLSKPKLYFFSFLLLELATATYHNARIFLPPMVAVLLFVYRKEIFKHKKTFLVSGLLALILYLPYLPTYWSVEGRARLVSESILKQPGEFWDNLSKNYLGNFDLDYLFFHGDQGGRHSVKKLGELYTWQLPFILLGIYKLLKDRNKASAVIFSWLLLGPVAAAITKVSPHALRSLNTVIAWQILCTVGLLQSKKVAFLIIPIAIFAMVSYLELYYVHYPKAYALDWDSGVKQTVEYLKNHENKYDQIFVSDSLLPEHLLFYLSYPPKLLQESEHNTKCIGKYCFEKLYTAPVKKNPDKKSLIVAPPYMVSDEIEVVREIRMFNGEPLYEIYEF